MWVPPNSTRYKSWVYMIVAQIPEGTVATYAQIASLIPPEPHHDPDQYHRLGARWVGWSLRHTPDDVTIPWHRVINSQGKISLPAGSEHAEEQHRRLAREGIQISASGRIKLSTYGWDMKNFYVDEDPYSQDIF